MNITEHDVTISLQHELDSDGEYGVMTTIHVDIFVNGKLAGTVRGKIVNRNKIPEGFFYSVMDGESADMQYISVSLFEPRYGRSKLQSLVQEGDDMKCDFLYISSLRVNQEFRTNGSSNVGTYALRKLLHHPFIRGNASRYGAWSTSSCIYILESKNAESRNHAIQFLRNGFFQDSAVVKNGSDCFLVAAYGHWRQPLKSHDEAAAIPFLEAPTTPSLTGLDAQIRKIIERPHQYSSNGNPNLYQADIARLMRQGGSLARARALHVACGKNNIPMIQFILRADPSALESQDETFVTPLMVAAQTAAGNATNKGFPRDQPVIDLLLASGARKDAIDSKGMTAYGILMMTHKVLSEAIQAMTGGPVRGAAPRFTPGLEELKAKLMPPGGPTAADLNGVIPDGFVDYSVEDTEHDQSFGYDGGDADY